MKSFLFLALIISSQAFALPYTCESEEMENNKPVLRFRVNPKVEVNGWRLYMVGVTPAHGFRQIVYGSGSADKNGIRMTFVKDDFVIGSVNAELHKDGMFYGEGNLNKSQTLTFKCVDSGKK